MRNGRQTVKLGRARLARYGFALDKQFETNSTNKKIAYRPRAGITKVG